MLLYVKFECPEPTTCPWSSLCVCVCVCKARLLMQTAASFSRLLDMYGGSKSFS